MDLTTLDRVRRLLGVKDPDDVSADAVLAQLITSVSAEVERALDRGVHIESRTEYFSPKWGQRKFPLSAWPVTSLVLTEAFDRDFTNGTVLDAADYVVDELGILTIDGWACATGWRTLRAVHTAGMALTASAFALAFPDLAGAVDQEVVAVYRKKDNLGLQALSMEGVSASYGTIEANGFQGRLKDAIKRHRREVACG